MQTTTAHGMLPLKLVAVRTASSMWVCALVCNPFTPQGGSHRGAWPLYKAVRMGSLWRVRGWGVDDSESIRTQLTGQVILVALATCDC